MYPQNEQNLHNLSKHGIHLRTDLNFMYLNDFVYLLVGYCMLHLLPGISLLCCSVLFCFLRPSPHRSVPQHPFQNEIRLLISLLLAFHPFASPQPIAGTTPSECPILAVFMLSHANAAAV